MSVKRIQTNKCILKKWCEKNMNVHTDWTGTRVETNDTCVSIDEFVDKLWNYLEEDSENGLTMEYTVIKKDWSIEFETNSQQEIEDYIKAHKDTIYQVICRLDEDAPFHVYWSK